MDRLPHTVLACVADWLTLAEVACAARTCRALRDALDGVLRREREAREALRDACGRALDLRHGEALRACAACRLPGARLYGELLAFVRRAPTLAVTFSGRRDGTYLSRSPDHPAHSWLVPRGIVRAAAAASGGDVSCVRAETLGADVSLGSEDVLGSRSRLHGATLLPVVLPGTVVRARWGRASADVEVWFVATPMDPADVTQGYRSPSPTEDENYSLRYHLTQLGASTCPCDGAAGARCDWTCSVGFELLLDRGGDATARCDLSATCGLSATWEDALCYAAPCASGRVWDALFETGLSLVSARGVPCAELVLMHAVGSGRCDPCP